MKPAISLICFLFFAFAMWAQPPAFPEGEAGVDYNRTTSAGEKTGPWVRVYPDGSVYYLGQFEKDVPMGLFYFYYEDGKLMSEVDHLDGKQHMYTKTYNNKGLLISEGHYRESKINGAPERIRDGVWKFYEQNQLVSEETYAMGILDGPFKVFYADGKPAEECTYKEGQKEGPWKLYFESGKLRGEGTSKGGDFDGDIVYYHPNGVKLIQGKYVNGLKDGTWIKFSSGGEIEIVTSYALGEIKAERRENGIFMDYYDNGIPKSEYEYSDGKKDGPFTEWHEVGEFVKVPLEEPLPGGGLQFREKLEGAQISREGDYMNGNLEGEITYYSEDGRILKVETYENGELISTEE